ncbi:uncharacterized protein LOC106868141 [Octopus bimaculoides]|uniref:Uncharacterized protein n=1 Tax=Octopus bimaculoides TaxID=37653 RepID=A0A0L8HWU0_OCTBM|nr:uncharacterized protein LOC106868141 [Octopus bimaculoides]|eukprot:XP_014768757.1 PREDICTED: uncharacterized protein LOC106868141 [Octopus bimaculoides]
MYVLLITVLTFGLVSSTLVENEQLQHQPNKTSMKEEHLNIPNNNLKVNRHIRKERSTKHAKISKSLWGSILYRNKFIFDREFNYPDVLSGKLKPNGHNWFTILPTPVLTHTVSLRTIVGLYITTLGHKRINEVMSEAVRFRKDSETFTKSHWAESHLLYYITFLKEGICTFGIVSLNNDIYENDSSYTHFLLVTNDYLLTSAYLYKHAVSKYKQIYSKISFPSVLNIMKRCLSNLPSARQCKNNKSDILTKYKCLPYCKRDNSCHKKTESFPKLMTHVLYFFISEFSAYQME